jgi:hypothetical protein
MNMRLTRKIWLLSISMLVASSSIFMAPARAIADMPVAGKTYTWNIIATNGVVEWYTNSWANLGNQSLIVNGELNFTLTGQYANNELSSNLTGNVWYGDFVNSGNLSHPLHDISTTEVGNALALSVQFYPIVAWSPGFIVSTNWTYHAEVLEAPGSVNITGAISGELFAVNYRSTFQTTLLEYELSTGVLLYAKTSAGNYSLEIILDGYSRGPSLPGFEPIMFFLVMTITLIAMISSSLGKKKMA